MPRPTRPTRPRTKPSAPKPVSAKSAASTSKGAASTSKSAAPASKGTAATSSSRRKTARAPAGPRRTTPRGGPRGDLITARNLVLNLDPKPAPPARVTAIRARLRLSQSVFAQLMGVSVFALRSWEQGLRDPSFMARRLLDEMEAHPAHWFDLLQKARIRK